MLTYNHESFIAQALDSIYMQDFPYQFEVVVGDDASHDGTVEILEKYATKYGNLTILTHENNMGIGQNMVRTFKACTGKYIAILEGDDYWTDHDKIKIQYEFMENNPEFVACFHDVVCLGRQNNIRFFDVEESRNRLTHEDFLFKNRIPTCSVFFRKKLEELPPVFKSFYLTDWPLHILLSKFGDYAYIPQVKGVYRWHESGAWSHKNSRFQVDKIYSMYKGIKSLIQSDCLPWYRRGLIRNCFNFYWKEIFPLCWQDSRYYRYLAKFVLVKFKLM